MRPVRWTARLAVLGSSLVMLVGTLVPAAHAVRPSRLFGSYPGYGTQAGDDLWVSVTLIADDDGTRLDGREVTYTVLDRAGTVLQQASLVTDAAGQATTKMRLDQPRGWYVARYSWPGDAEFAAHSDEHTFYASPREVVIGAMGTFWGWKGQTVRLGAYLRDRWAYQPLSSRTVRFQLPWFDGTATTDASGYAWLDVPVAGQPGRYTFRVSREGDSWYADASAAQSFDVVWPWSFRDAGGAGHVRLNPYAQEFRLELTGCVTTVKHDPYMTTSDGRTTTLAYRDTDTTLSGTFELDDRDFEAAATACGKVWSLKQVSL